MHHIKHVDDQRACTLRTHLTQNCTLNECLHQRKHIVMHFSFTSIPLLMMFAVFSILFSVHVSSKIKMFSINTHKHISRWRWRKRRKRPWLHCIYCFYQTFIANKCIEIAFEKRFSWNDFILSSVKWIACLNCTL